MPTTRLAERLSAMNLPEGVTTSPLPNVYYFRSSISRPRAPVVYDPGIVVLAQGSKTGHLGDRSYVYDARHYLVLSLPMPFECETNVEPGKPLLGVGVTVSPALIAELLLDLGETAVANPPEHSVEACVTPPEMIDAAERLVAALDNERDTRLLAPAIAREIAYRALVGDRGDALRAVAARHGRYAEIAGVLREMHASYDRTFNVEDLAGSLKMSPAMFHRHFKAITATTPLQYLKAIRLDKARLLMASEGIPASVAATRVGYESRSQFSREFKKHFGATPTEEAAKWRGHVPSS